jgi:hypothetical protein
VSVVDDVANALASAGLGIYDIVGTTSTIFTHLLPDAPASAYSVELYGAAPPGPYLFGGTLPEWENPRIQITKRDPDAGTAYAGCLAAVKALIALTDVSLGGVHYFSIRLVNGPLSLGRDENNLWRYVANLQCMKGFS